MGLYNIDTLDSTLFTSGTTEPLAFKETINCTTKFKNRLDEYVCIQMDGRKAALRFALSINKKVLN